MGAPDCRRGACSGGPAAAGRRADGGAGAAGCPFPRRNEGWVGSRSARRPRSMPSAGAADPARHAPCRGAKEAGAAGGLEYGAGSGGGEGARWPVVA